MRWVRAVVGLLAQFLIAYVPIFQKISGTTGVKLEQVVMMVAIDGLFLMVDMETRVRGWVLGRP